MIKLTIASVVVTLVVIPVAVIAIRSFFGPVEAVAVFVGSAISTGFFASTAIVGIATWNSADLRSSLIGMYAVKVSLLILVGIALAPADLDAGAFVTGAVASAISYLLVQVFTVSRDRKDRNK